MVRRPFSFDNILRLYIKIGVCFVRAHAFSPSKPWGHLLSVFFVALESSQQDDDVHVYHFIKFKPT